MVGSIISEYYYYEQNLPVIKRSEKRVGKWGDSLVVALTEEFREIAVKYRGRVIVEVHDASAIIIKPSRVK